MIKFPASEAAALALGKTKLQSMRRMIHALHRDAAVRNCVFARDEYFKQLKQLDEWIQRARKSNEYR